MPTNDPRQHIVALTEEGREAVTRLRALGVSPEHEGEYLRLASMLAAASSTPPEEGVTILAKIAARGRVMSDDIAALQRLYPPF